VIDAQLTSTFASVAIFGLRTIASLGFIVAGSSPFLCLALLPVAFGYYYTAK